jgi:hypothetical protein
VTHEFSAWLIWGRLNGASRAEREPTFKIIPQFDWVIRMIDFFKAVAENITSSVLPDYLLPPLVMSMALDGVIRFVFGRIFLPAPGVLSNPLGRVMFGNEALDCFGFAIRPQNIDTPAKPGVFPRHESWSLLGHPSNMRLWPPDSSQLSCHNQTDPLPKRRSWVRLKITPLVRS